MGDPIEGVIEGGYSCIGRYLNPPSEDMAPLVEKAGYGERERERA